jgi:hypothetical protein
VPFRLISFAFRDTRGANIHESGEETSSVVAAVAGEGESRSGLLAGVVRDGTEHSANYDRPFCPAALAE